MATNNEFVKIEFVTSEKTTTREIERKNLPRFIMKGWRLVGNPNIPQTIDTNAAYVKWKNEGLEDFLKTLNVTDEVKKEIKEKIEEKQEENKDEELGV